MKEIDLVLRFRLGPIAIATGMLVLTGSLAAGTTPEPATLADLVTLENVDAVAPGGAVRDGRPISLASGDFDEDGIADLVVGVELDGHGALMIHPGSRHAIYPHSSAPKVTDDPFLASTASLETSAGPDVLAADDFDGDGHRDLIAAALGSTVLEVFRGRGDGSFEAPEPRAIGGRLTALTSGEIHRRDGIADLVIGIVGDNGPSLLVLSDPAGALHAPAERLALPALADQLMLGSFGHGPAHDLALVAGQRLWILAGGRRGQATNLEAVRQAGPVIAATDSGGRLAVLSPTGKLALIHRNPPDTKAVGGPAWTITPIGEISITEHTSSANNWRLTPCRLSTAPTPDLLVHDLRTGRLELVMTSPPVDPPDHIVALAAPYARTAADLSVHAETGSASWPPVTSSRQSEKITHEIGAVAAALTMRLSPDALDDLVVLPHSGPASQVLMTRARATFIVDSTGDEEDAAIGDGLCAVGSGECTLRAAISEANFAADLDTISFAIPDQSDPGCDPVRGICTIQVGAGGFATIIQPVVLDATTQPGFAGTPLIELDGTLTGTNISGFAVWGGGTTIRGFAINRFANNSDIAAWNLGTNVFEGNFLGTDPTGTTNLGSLNSLHVSGITETTIGGTASEARNLISGNTGPALALNNAAFDNHVEGNTFGLDATGTIGLGNLGNDILVMNGSTGNTIGGTAAGAANTIAANQAADYPSFGVAFNSSGNLIQGNRIGTDVNGADSGNLGIAVTIVDAADNTLGGVVPGAGNLIAYNGLGVDLRGDTSTGNSIVGNSIHSNDFLGIDLCVDEDPVTGSCLDVDDVTPNDPGDPDIGCNNLQNFPDLTTVDRVGSTVEGSLDSIPSSAFTIDLYVNATCDPTGNGEGESHAGSTPVVTDAGGIGTFTMSLPSHTVGGAFLTATATDSGGSTSEFSACLEIPPAADLQLEKSDSADPVWVGGSLIYTIDLTNNGPDDATGVGITDVLPTDTVFVTASPSCVHVSGTVTCTVGDLSTLGASSVFIEVTVGDPPGGQLTNTATVSATEPDSDPSNNSATETTLVVDPLFADGFEDGTTDQWSSTIGG